MRRLRFSDSRRRETALALDMCASSRWALGLRMELQGFEGGLDTDTVYTNDLGWLTDLHWRSISLAGSAFYATMYADHVTARTFHEICAEAAQRLREGWHICEGGDLLYVWDDFGTGDNK